MLTSAYGAACECELRPLAVGSTQALAYLERGEVELAITHAPELEREYSQRHPGSERSELMMNEFILTGPPADPAGVRGLDLTAALRRVAQHEALFFSRADGSGTNRAERRLWVEAQDEIPEEEEWYRAASVSMAKLLLVAAQQRAYAISDSATLAYLQERQGLQLEVLAQDQPPRANVYSVLLSPGASPAAREFAAWLQSGPAQDLIRAYRIAGEPAFRPVAP